MKAFRFLKAAAIAGLVFPLTACLNNQQDDGSRLQRDDFSPYVFHDNSRLELGRETADAVAADDGVKSAVVLLTDKNAYVAVVLQEEADTFHGGIPADGISEELRRRIAKKVRSLHPGLREVYVSAHPDFVRRMNRFAAALQEGQPAERLIREFNTMVERVFPANGKTPRTPNNIPGANGKMNR